MPKLHHPKNKAERLISAQKKERERLRKAEREQRIQAKLVREGLKVKETEDELHQVPIL